MRLPTLERMVCVKYLFQQGVELFERRGPFAAGMAILAFHDALEMALRTIAEHVDAPVRDKSVFNQVLDDIEGRTGVPLPLRSALLQLNQARVSFKHSGLEPRDTDVRKFRGDLDTFFPIVCSRHLNLNFSELSLVDLIAHTRTRNWLRKAERLRESGEYEQSIEASAVGFAIFRATHAPARHQRAVEDALADSQRRVRDNSAHHPALSDIAKVIDEQIDDLQGQLDVLSAGLSADAHQRFEDLSPVVHLSTARTIHVSGKWTHAPVDYESSLFCSSFVIDAALKLQVAYRPNPFARIPLTRRFRVVKEANVIVYPGDASEEVIARLGPGTEVVGYYEKRDMPGFTAVLFDGDCAYIAADCIDPVGD